MPNESAKRPNIAGFKNFFSDYKNDFDFFLRFVKRPKIAVKKAKFFRNFRNKSRSILMLHKIGKNKTCAPKLIFFNKKSFRKIRVIFDVEN